MTRQLPNRERPLICRLSWHAWSRLPGDDPGRYFECRRCRHTAVAAPKAVRKAWALLVAIGVLALGNAIIGLVVRRHFNGAVNDFQISAGAPDAPLVVAEISSALTYNVIGGLAAALAVVLLGAALRKPRRWARTATAIGLGIQVLFLMIFISVNPAHFAEPGDLGSTVGRSLWDNLVPDWYGPSFYALGLLMLALSVAVAVQLCRGRAREYFSEGVRQPVPPLTPGAKRDDAADHHARVALLTR
jgi:hypothetical protein